MYVVIVNRASVSGAEKQWTLLTPLDWNTNGIISQQIAEDKCVELRKDSPGIECKVQQLVDVE